MSDVLGITFVCGKIPQERCRYFIAKSNLYVQINRLYLYIKSCITNRLQRVNYEKKIDKDINPYVRLKICLLVIYTLSYTCIVIE